MTTPRQWFDVDQLAQIAHEANRGLQAVLGEAVGAPWDDLDTEMQESIRHGVRVVQEGNGPEELHRQWVMVKEALGWTYGPVKDFEAKTHPQLVPWDELPILQRAKDQLFHGVVSSLERPTTEGDRP
ncbi:hypothetical protein SEA_DALANDE_57 [Gordonia phage DalanDe]|nr:hypothetical protein SEA_DALANDE_57 [Gordonia phage DalanDe]